MNAIINVKATTAESTAEEMTGANKEKSIRDLAKLLSEFPAKILEFKIKVICEYD